MRLALRLSTVLLVLGAAAMSRADLAPPRQGTGPKPSIRWVAEPQPDKPGDEPSNRESDDAGGSDPVIVTVGRTQVRASELSFLLGRLHEFEREGYGKTPAEVKLGFIQRRLVPLLLAAEEADRIGTAKKPDYARHVRKQLVDALVAELRSKADASLTDAQIREYCESDAGRKPISDAGTSKACSGDLSGHRVALRRTIAAKQLDAMSESLRRQRVRGLNYAALSLIDVSDRGTSVAVPLAPASSRAR